jgi:transposase-like protein
MTILPPVAASGAREPERAARRIPAKVKASVIAMVTEGIDLVAAAQANNLRPASLRQWLHRPEVAALVRSERKAYRQAILCAAEHALADVMNNAENSQARVNAAKAIIEVDRDEYAHPHAGERTLPGVTIRILNVTAAPTGPSSFVDVLPGRVIDAGE